MAFGAIYSREETAWKQGLLYAKTATGWMPVVHLYEKTGVSTLDRALQR